MKARLATVVALAIVSLMSSTGIVEASPLPPLKMRNGFVTMCLTPAAQTAFTANTLRLDAIAPSTYSTTSDGRSCVRFTIEGETNLNVTNAHAKLFGGFDFSDAEGRHLRLTNLTARTRGTDVVGTAKLDDQPGEVEVLTVDVLQANITPKLLPLGIKATAPVTQTDHLANAMRSAFGTSPLGAGALMFDAAGEVDLGPSILGLPVGHAG